MREEFHKLRITHLLCHRTQRSIAGHLIVLDSLDRSNQGQIRDCVILFFAFFNMFLSFFNQALHRLARFGLGFFTEKTKAFLQTIDLALSLVEMLGKNALQLGMMSSLGELGKSFYELPLSVKKVFHLIYH